MAETRKATPMKMDKTEQQEVATKRTVSFSPRVKVRTARSLKSYTAEQKQDSWYTRQDFDRMQKETKATLVIMKTFQKATLTQEQDSSDSFCFRGLEWKLPSGALLKLQIRKISTAAVLCEQRRQREGGVTEVDPTLIARAYSKFSGTAAQVARRNGIQDEEAAASYNPSESPSASNVSPSTMSLENQRTISKNKTRLTRRSNKFGTTLPSSIRVA